ncbi:hypothetical protein GA0074696_2724 [Micromonospora purpureochromogenes]|uniref:Uncharacterized protein n=1 Tax=Micromonospora purpureochromogenes TaxID=47872 RepID=A0A1C4XNT6_9ACTN|nr:hypothetical protein GA0074696_2724 [Micromonospora purpureochromogenes]
MVAGVRGSRSAGRLFTDRLARLTRSYPAFGQALHDAALATITKRPRPHFHRPGGLVQTVLVDLRRFGAGTSELVIKARIEQHHAGGCSGA